MAVRNANVSNLFRNDDDDDDDRDDSFDYRRFRVFDAWNDSVVDSVVVDAVVV
eukprot:CAMPEP_0201677978 /NCGR_PEP_ID=MMETSP0494-20130426/45280_1 /ASSEMBLY_ACC=CAM_ASM_000839 /TAXON_ID=420259 /ORGANISM="Thalassiosira gravida, Strain GMp14c1" /LENGTH=52 /DNA_ID=CAMNT_0048161049 /DNA_START=61 /DNA_END=216 /DNA_ORIENTATION=-